MSDKIEFRAKVQMANGDIRTMRYRTTESDNDKFDMDDAAFDDYMNITRLEANIKAHGNGLLEPITKHYI